MLKLVRLGMLDDDWVQRTAANVHLAKVVPILSSREWSPSPGGFVDDVYVVLTHVSLVVLDRSIADTPIVGTLVESDSLSDPSADVVYELEPFACPVG